MRKELNDEKECKNCIHYLRHYIKYGIRFMSIQQGHCVSKKPSGHFRKTDRICECYEERDLTKEKEENMQSVTEKLSFISQCISELTQILKIFADQEEQQKNY